MEVGYASLALSQEGVEGMERGLPHGDEVNRVGQNDACCSQLAVPGLGPEGYENDGAEGHRPRGKTVSPSCILGSRV